MLRRSHSLPERTRTGEQRAQESNERIAPPSLAPGANAEWGSSARQSPRNVLHAARAGSQSERGQRAPQSKERVARNARPSALALDIIVGETQTLLQTVW